MSHKHLFSRFLEADPARDTSRPQPPPVAQYDVRRTDRVLGGCRSTHRSEVVTRLRARAHDVATVHRRGAVAARSEDDRVRAEHPRVRGEAPVVLPGRRPIHVVTTGSEFHSFRRQSERMAEVGELAVTAVPTEPYETFTKRLVAAIDRRAIARPRVPEPGLLRLGVRRSDLAGVVRKIPEDVMVVVDGYHGFMALPTNLSAIAHRAFYMSGSYKYAMAGEGMTFMHCRRDTASTR